MIPCDGLHCSYTTIAGTATVQHKISIYMYSVRWPVITASLLYNIRLLQTCMICVPQQKPTSVLGAISYCLLKHYPNRLLFRLLYNSTKLVGCSWSGHEIAALKFIHTEHNPLLHRLNYNVNYIFYYYSDKHYRFIKLPINMCCSL